MPLTLATSSIGAPIAAGVGPNGIALTPGLKFTQQIVRNQFLNRTELVLIVRWQPHPLARNAIAYQVFNNDVLVATVSARSPLEYRQVVCCGDDPGTFLIIPVE